MSPINVCAYMLASILLLLSANQCSVTCSSPKLIEQGVPFSLQVSLQISGQTDNHELIQYQIDLVESSSSEEHQTKIKYNVIGGLLAHTLEMPTQGTIYHSQRSMFKFAVVDERQRSCQVIDLKHFKEVILPKHLRKHMLFNIMGPSGILFDSRQKLSDAKPIDDKMMNEVRNVQVTSYAYRAEDGSNYTFQFATDQQLAIPMRIVVEETDRKLVYDFIALDMAPIIGPKIGHSLSWTADNWWPQLEVVTIEPGLGCSTELLSSLRETDVSKLDFDQMDYSFSFVAQVKYPKLVTVVDISVAWDNNLGTLRVDRFSGLGEHVSTSMISNRMTGLVYITSRDQVFFDSNSKRPSERQCLMLEEAPSSKSKLSARKVLFGVDKPLVYLGLAQVRGLRTRVYEVEMNGWPGWLRKSFAKYEKLDEQFQGKPSTYKQRSPRLESTESSAGSKQFNYAIIHLAMPEINLNNYTHPELEHTFDWRASSIVQIELIRTMIRDGPGTPRSGAGRVVVRVSDFQWSVPTKSFANQRAEDLFSLGDLCPPRAGEQNHWASAKMTLLADTSLSEMDTFLESKWLHIGRQRNLALLAWLQRNLSIPATIINDFESSIISSPGHGQLGSEHLVAGDRTPLRIGVSFNLAEHQLDTTKLVYLGQAKSGQLERANFMLREYQVIDFQDCLYRASNQLGASKTLLAFDGSTCLIGREHETTLKLVLSDDSGGGSFDVFRVVHVDANTSYRGDSRESGDGDEISKLIHGLVRFKLVASEHSLSLWHDDERSKLSFNTKSFEISELDDKTPNGNGKWGDTNKLAGFGLVDTEVQYNRLLRRPDTVQSTSFHGSNATLETGMTFGQCQAACLSDFECKSYSVCVKFGGTIECILSKVNFRNLVIWNKTIWDQKAARNQLILLDIEHLGRINLRRDANCELHNKIYLQLFTKKRPAKLDIDRSYNIYAVNSREKCAQLCFNQTLATLGQATTRAQEINYKLISRSSGTRNVSNVAQIYEQIREHRASSGNICKKVRYLDAVKLIAEPNFVGEQFRIRSEMPNNLALINGYCLIEHSGGQKINLNNSQKWRNNLRVELYQPDLERLFFERKPGIRLKISKGFQELGLDPTDLIDKSRRANCSSLESLITREQYESLRSLVDLGENNQRYVFSTYDESNCAQICLDQAKGPWPACKSFSLVRNSRSATGGRTPMKCYLNSITLREALQMGRFDLIEENDHDGQAWHFDPKLSGLILSDQEDEESKLLLAATGQLVAGSPASWFVSFSMFVLVFAALVGGLAMGIKLGASSSSRSSGPRETSRLVATNNKEIQLDSCPSAPEDGRGHVEL